MFHYSHDEHIRDMVSQVMLGPDILVAPVLFPGATSVEVYLPEDPDKWVRWPSMAEARPGNLVAEAPFGEPAVFIRAGFRTRFPSSWQALEREGKFLIKNAAQFKCPAGR